MGDFPDPPTPSAAASCGTPSKLSRVDEVAPSLPEPPTSSVPVSRRRILLLIVFCVLSAVVLVAFEWEVWLARARDAAMGIRAWGASVAAHVLALFSTVPTTREQQQQQQQRFDTFSSHEEYTTASPSPPPPSSAASTSMDRLQLHAHPIPYAEETFLPSAAAAARRPIVWRQAQFARSWRAHTTWSKAGVLDSLVPWLVARTSEGGGQDEGEFVLTAPQRGGRSQLLTAAPMWEPLRAPTFNTSVGAVLSGTGPSVSTSTGGAASGGHRRYYYSGSIGESSTRHWQSERILSDLSPLDQLRLDDVPPLLPEEARAQAAAGGGPPPANFTSMRLWMTSADVLARTHYDKSHNILCMLQGAKRLVLWPPEQLPALHLYPAVHEAHRQSQLSPLRLGKVREALRDGRTPTLPGVSEPFALLDAPAALGMRRGAMQTELREGDCLYTPPYWAHTVLSPTPSVALAAFSTSWEQARWARSGWLRVPLGRFAQSGLCSKARGAALLISAFVHACDSWTNGGEADQEADQASSPSPDSSSSTTESLLGGVSPRAFLASTYASRYAPIYGELHTANEAAAGPGASGEALVQCLGAPPHMLAAGTPELDPELRGRVRAFAASVAGLLARPDASAAGRRFAPAVARELASDYVEEIAGWACGADGAWRLLRLLALTEETDVGHGHLHQEL
jgi:hypothetical protein